MKNSKDSGKKRKRVGMGIPPSLQDEYLKQTFGLTDEQIEDLGKIEPEQWVKKWAGKPEVKK